MKVNPSNWKRMAFKGNKVWIAIDNNGKPIVENNKVLVKYQLEQDYEYWIKENNVVPIDQVDWEKEKSKKNASRDKKGIQIKEELNMELYSNAVCIFTDGASSGNPGPSGIGVFMKYGKNEKEISEYIGVATNNIAELEAVRVALSRLKRTDLPVRIFLDSKYVFGLIVLGWKAQKNQELVKSIRELATQFKDLMFIKINGHSGIDGNEKADLLATGAIKNARQ